MHADPSPLYEISLVRLFQPFLFSEIFLFVQKLRKLLKAQNVLWGQEWSNDRTWTTLEEDNVLMLGSVLKLI
jgi:hypothetical protein